MYVSVGVKPFDAHPYAFWRRNVRKLIPRVRVVLASRFGDSFNFAKFENCPTILREQENSSVFDTAISGFHYLVRQFPTKVRMQLLVFGLKSFVLESEFHSIPLHPILAIQ